MKTLHVFGPKLYHDGAHIVGNRQALLTLRRVVDEALRSGVAEGRGFYTNDGEGFPLSVFLRDDMEAIAVPYSMEWARETRETFLLPVEAHGGHPPRLVPWRRLSVPEAPS